MHEHLHIMFHLSMYISLDKINVTGLNEQSR